MGWKKCSGIRRSYLEFFGSVPEILIQNNLKSGVNRACRYGPKLNPSSRPVKILAHLLSQPTLKKTNGMTLAQNQCSAKSEIFVFLQAPDKFSRSHVI